MQKYINCVIISKFNSHNNNNNNNFAGIGIVINVAGCLIRGRRRWSVTYTSPRDYVFQNFLKFGIEGHFRRENLTSFLVGRKTLLTIARPGREPTTSRTPRLHNKQGVPHPTCSAIGRRSILSI